jgi:predicted RNA-binding protein with RPS1 domain
MKMKTNNQLLVSSMLTLMASQCNHQYGVQSFVINVQPVAFNSQACQQQQQRHNTNNRGQSLFYAAEDDDDEDEDAEDVLLFSSDWEDGEEPPATPQSTRTKPAVSATQRGSTSWDRMDADAKQRVIKEGQSKAIANKKKREPATLRRNRMMMYMKNQQRKRKTEARVTRPLAFNSKERQPLENLQVGQMVATNGTVISITAFGAYVDVGTEACDGLLHISQLRHLDLLAEGGANTFVEKVSDVLQPGDQVEQALYVTKVSAELKKIQLSLLSPADALMAHDEDDESSLDQITLEDLEVEDELWGEIVRVTKFGAYVEVGAVVEGWLHFMDHPDWGDEGGHSDDDKKQFQKNDKELADDNIHMQTPGQMMKLGERVRLWVQDLDGERQRIKLTGNRPLSLPQIRRNVIRR